MEIIHVVLGKCNPERMNGVNKVVNELATQQVLTGENVSLWGITHSLEHDYPPRNYKTVLFRAHKNKFKVDKKLVDALRVQNKQVIFHVHGGFIPVFASLAGELHKRKLPFVFTPHGSYNLVAMEKSKWTKRIYINLYEKKVLKYAQSIHCLGRSELNGLQFIYPNDKAVLIPYGFAGSGERASNQGGNGFILGFCGRIDIHTKGLDILLKAFSLFTKHVSKTELWIIGDSIELPDLKEMAKDLNVHRNTCFYGSVFGDKKIDLLKQMQAFVHPSRNEGLPTAVLEAASLGVPCIVTEATNVGDSIRRYDAGDVIDEPDPTKLHEAISKIYNEISNQGINRLSGNARRMINEEYNWKTIIEHFHNLYQRA